VLLAPHVHLLLHRALSMLMLLLLLAGVQQAALLAVSVHSWLLVLVT
jgi:hypothetical protein